MIAAAGLTRTQLAAHLLASVEEDERDEVEER